MGTLFSLFSLSLSFSLSLFVYYNNTINKIEWYRTKFIKTGSFGPVKHAMIGTFVVAFGLEHYMHHKYHSHHDETHGGGKGEGVNENKTHQSHSPKEFSAETASLDEITKEMTRLRERVGELRKEGKHV